MYPRALLNVRASQKPMTQASASSAGAVPVVAPCGPCSPSVPDRRAQNCSWANSSCSNSSRRRRPDGENAQPPALAEGKPIMALDRVQLGDGPNGPVQPGGSRPLDGLRWGRPTPATSSLATSGSSGPTSSGLLLKCRSLPCNLSPLHGSPKNLASSALSQQSTTTIASLSCTRRSARSSCYVTTHVVRDYARPRRR
jgi:hypothetical protein